MIIAVICIIVVLLIIILWAVFTNNSLIAKKNRVKQCRSGICVVLKQRNNLIPNLVASVKAYMGTRMRFSPALPICGQGLRTLQSPSR